MPPLPVKLNGPGASVGADGLVYISGGTTTATNFSGSSSTTYVLDPHTRALVNGPGLNAAHAYHSSVLGDDGYVYVMGGSTTPSSGGGTGAVDKINTFATAAPEFLSPPQQYAVVAESYDAGAFFKANPRPTFTLLSGPSGMSVDSQTGVLHWTPAVDQVGMQAVTLEAANAFGSTVATFDIQTLDLPPDVHAPTAPANLRQIGGGLTSIEFAWDAARDDRGVDHYKLYKFVRINRFTSYWGVAADNIVGTEMTLTPANSGRYRISAVDAAGNESPLSAEVSAATYRVPSLSHRATNDNEFVYAIVDDGLYVGDSSQSFVPAAYVIADTGNPQATLSVDTGPAGVTVDSQSGIVSWTPTAADVGAHTITIRGTNPVGFHDFVFTVDVHSAGTDLIRPTTITTPTATATTPIGGTITWNGATDNVGVVGQRVYGRLVGTTTSFVVADLPATAASYTITDFQPGTGYMLWVSAYDAAGNEGPHVGTVFPLFLTTNDNTAPVATNDDYTTAQGYELNVAVAAGVLANDVDADGHALTVDVGLGPLQGDLTLNSDGSFIYTPRADFVGLDTITYTVNDGFGGTDTATISIIVTPVRVESVLINGGAIQRSTVKEATVTFDSIVDIDQTSGDPFQFVRRGSGEIVVDTPVISTVAGKTVVQFSFNTGATVDSGGSLFDGDYMLTVDANLISAHGIPLDGNGDGSSGGNHSFGDREVDAFFRFFGDNDGDRDVDTRDLVDFGSSFRSSVVDAAFNPGFDSDNDGDVDTGDLIQFGMRFRDGLPFN